MTERDCPVPVAVEHFDHSGLADISERDNQQAKGRRRMSMSHLERLEAEAIIILREVAAAFERPVLLYSIGKDSSVLLHLARKAFFPAKQPFPLLHIDTTWKFR